MKKTSRIITASLFFIFFSLHCAEKTGDFREEIDELLQGGAPGRAYELVKKNASHITPEEAVRLNEKAFEGTFSRLRSPLRAFFDGDEVHKIISRNLWRLQVALQGINEGVCSPEFFEALDQCTKIQGCNYRPILFQFQFAKSLHEAEQKYNEAQLDYNQEMTPEAFERLRKATERLELARKTTAYLKEEIAKLSF